MGKQFEIFDGQKWQKLTCEEIPIEPNIWTCQSVFDKWVELAHPIKGVLQFRTDDPFNFEVGNKYEVKFPEAENYPFLNPDPRPKGESA